MPGGPGRAQLLAEAVRVLTAAAKLPRPVMKLVDAQSGSTEPVLAETGRVEQGDWAELVTQALAGAIANIGGIEAVLAGRPGSWEADHVRNLLTSTVGHDEKYLLEHRTEPLQVDLFVDGISDPC